MIAMTAGTSVSRTMKASRKTPAAKLKPIASAHLNSSPGQSSAAAESAALEGLPG